MQLTSMKCDENKDTRPADVMYGATPAKQEYPYGLQLCLNDESLDKLGIETLPKIGDELTITAKVKVTAVSERADQDDTNQNMELQITDMAIGGK